VIDEAQDTNAARRLLALKILKPNGRLVAVGDPHQAIYGFTGADADALNLIGASKNAKTLPLTVTYRCPKAVVSYAQQWVKDIEAHPSAPEGVVRSEDDNFKLVDSVKPYDAILCRFNAPLVENVYQFIAKGIPAKIEGREIGEGLKTLARRWKVRNFDQLLERLGKYEAKEVAKFQKKEQPTRVQGVQDKCQCLRTLITRTIEVGYTGDCVAALCAQIESIFADNVNGGHVVLTSIHKSKGREWNKVFWLQTGASTLAKQEWEQVQENNLCYVAATRAKAELILVPAPKKVK
jgi:superfamily I DNA/RNA helicase